MPTESKSTSLENVLIGRRTLLKVGLFAGLTGRLGSLASAQDLEKKVQDSGKIAFTVRKHHTQSVTRPDWGIDIDLVPYELWTVNPDGSDLRRLHDDLRDSRVRFSPNAKYLAFNKIADKDFMGRFAITDLDGKVVCEFSTSAGKKDFSWTPDGERILSGHFNDAIYIHELKTGKARRIIPSRGYVYDHNPAMSPDLKHIAYVHHEYGHQYSIRVIPSSGNIFTIICKGTSNHNEHLNLDWLDNTHIIYNVSHVTQFRAPWVPATRNQICYINTKTSQGKTLDADHISSSFMRLSPDKKTLAFFYGGLAPRLPRWEGEVRFIDTDELAEIPPSRKASDISVLPILDYNDIHSEGFAIASHYSERSSSSRALALSQSGRYLVIAYPVRSRKDPLIQLFDKSGKEYEFLTANNLPEKISGFNHVSDIDWSCDPK